MEIHERLKATREDLEITQEQAASAAGYTRRQYIRHEQGQSEMTISKFKELCLFFGVSADYLLGLPHNLNWPRIENKKMTCLFILRLIATLPSLTDNTEPNWVLIP